MRAADVLWYSPEAVQEKPDVVRCYLGYHAGRNNKVIG
jgi:hypothetical protein